MKRAGTLLKQLIAAVIGVPLLVIGLILIPLPGPGLLVSFTALFILSLAFETPKKYLERLKEAFRKIYATAKERADKIEQRGKK